MKQNRNAFCGGAYSLILSAVVLTILIVVNILVNALPENLTKYDISAAKLYSCLLYTSPSPRDRG